MGLNLRRVAFQDWLKSVMWEPILPQFLETLEQKIGRKLPFDDWTVVDNEYPRVGNYAEYAVFRDCLLFLMEGDFETQLEPDENLERVALENFRQNLSPGSTNLPFVDHFLKTNDASTIFLPAFFEKPIRHYEIDIASLPAANVALESFAEVVSFNLLSDSDEERVDGKWIPTATAKNVGRLIYQFFNKKDNSCVVFS